MGPPRGPTVALIAGGEGLRHSGLSWERMAVW